MNGEPVMADTWNSLEIAKLIVSGLVPIVVILLGLKFNGLVKRIEHAQWANRTIIEWRIKVYDEIAVMLNDILCYYTFVGNWKEITPPQLIETKRKLDKKIHTSAPLFSPDFLGRYFAFTEICFKTYGGWGTDARLRTPADRHRNVAGEAWDPTWNESFCPDSECEDPNRVREVYQDLMRNFARELGLGLNSGDIPAGAVPTHVLPAGQQPKDDR